MSDATTQSLERFDSPDHWDYVAENVPIFVPHVMKDKAGTTLYIVDQQRLQKIADKINHAYRHEGCPTKWTEGHTKDPKTTAQKDQPDILAFGVGAHVGQWGPQKRWGVIQDKVFYRKGKFASAKELPERSPEFYEPQDEIRVVALLKTDPKLNMGMQIYGQDSRDGLYLYAVGPDGMAADPTSLPPDKNAPEPGSGDPSAMISPEDKAKFLAFMKACCPKLWAMCEEDQSMAANQTPTSTPNPVSATPAPQPYTRDEMAAHYERLKAEAATELQKLKAEAAAEREALAGERRAVNYERDLIGLAKLVKLDVAEELAFCRDMDQAKFDAHKVRIVKNYQRDPTSYPTVPPEAILNTKGEVVSNDPDRITEEHGKRAQQYMRVHPTCEFEEAIEKTRQPSANGTPAAAAK